MTPRCYENPLDIAQLRRHHASIDAYAGTRLVTLDNGSGRGVRLIEMRSGAGLEAEIVVDRSFDIGRLARDGETVSWHTPNGYRHPALIDLHGEGGQGYLRGLSGFLSTCGFDHIRQPETEAASGLPLHPTAEIQYPLHGLGAHQPALLIGHGLCENAERSYLWCEGEIIQSMTFRGALRLRRRIEMPVAGDTLSIRDTVQNIGPHPVPSMMLYHFNLGHPLVDAESRLQFEAEQRWTSTDHDPRAPFGRPSDEYVSEISVHAASGPRGVCHLSNQARGLDLAIEFDTKTLPYLQLLRLRGAGYYMAGIEPCTAAHRSRHEARAAGEIPMLAPEETREFALDVSLNRTITMTERA